MKKFIKPLIIVLIGTLLILGSPKIFRVPNDFITYERIVKNVERKDKNIYFEFIDDYEDKDNKILNIYSFTEYDGVTSDSVFNNIKVGDSVKITIENNKGNFKYILLQKVEKDGIIIFDSIEYYQNHNINLRIIFISTISTISLALIILSFINLEKNNNARTFIIRFKLLLYYYVPFTLLGGISIIMFTIMLLTNRMSFNTYKFSFIFYIFLVLGIFGIISFHYSYIKYDFKYYYVHRLFHKTIIIDKNNIGKILFDLTKKRRNNKSGLYDKNNIIILDLSYEFHYYLSKGYFVESLRKNGVKFINLTKDNNGNEIETEATFL